MFCGTYTGIKYRYESFDKKAWANFWLTHIFQGMISVMIGNVLMVLRVIALWDRDKVGLHVWIWPKTAK